MRIGLGYDIHRLVSGRALMLGGIAIPFQRGLLGHSDGDALLHAIADALLGATALGDIGARFPDTDPKYKDADSKTLLRDTAALLRHHGYRIVNIDSNILAQAPKLSPYRKQMAEQIAGCCGLAIESVSVKMRTGEGLDAIGRGEAIATQAVALVELMDDGEA